MTESPQDPPIPTSPFRKVALTCGTLTFVASLTLSLVAIAAAVLILLDILP